MNSTPSPPAVGAKGAVENEPTMRFLADDRGDHRWVDARGPVFERFCATFARPKLSRPAILDAAEVRQLDHDLPALLRILQSIPERLFDGDEAAFAQAIGWTAPGVAEALRLLSGPAVALGRADLVRSPEGFKVVEFNTSSSLGAFEFGELSRSMLSDPAFADFAREAGLDYHNSIRMMAETLVETTGLDFSDHPTIALLDWISSPLDVDTSLFVRLMEEFGFTVIACRIDELDFRKDGVYTAGRRIDVAYRTFLLKTVAENPNLDLLARLADAVRDGLVSLFTPLNADLFGTKSCLAMLTDGRNREAFSQAELDVIDRTLPWTRMVREKGSLPDGSEISLVNYILDHREELVLKPTIGHAGWGVIAGWMVTPEEWESQIRAATDGNFIVQQRVHSVPERFYFPGATRPSTCFLHWGLFVTRAGLSGGFIKGPLDREQDIRYRGDGSHLGCIFHVRPE